MRRGGGKAPGDTDMLVRSPEPGPALAKTLGARTVALMRGHGAVIVAGDPPHAVFHRAAALGALAAQGNEVNSCCARRSMLA